MNSLCVNPSDSPPHRLPLLLLLLPLYVCLCALARERCGGAGYLSVNRFGELIGFAHAGMTAEGDNR